MSEALRGAILMFGVLHGQLESFALIAISAYDGIIMLSH